MPTSKTYSSQCTYVAQGEAFPESLRYIYYASDPAELMTILSIDGDSANFAVSFDLVEVDKYIEPLTTNTLEASTDFSLVEPMPLKIYKGTSIMSLVKTVGVGGDSDVVYTWSNLLTSTGQPDADDIGACCNGGLSEVTFANADGSTYTGSYPSCGSGTLDDSLFVTMLQASPTMTVVTVSDPFDATVIVALIGGWFGTMEVVAFVLIKIMSGLARKREVPSEIKSEIGDLELGDNVKGEASSDKAI